MRLFVIRHARTAWNDEGRAQGHTDIPLDAEGQKQAEALAASFSHGDAVRIVSSDLARCRQTAEPLARKLGLELEINPTLRERSFGDHEGMAYDAVASLIQHQRENEHTDRFRTRPPNGESFEDLWNRTLPFVRSLFEETRDTVVVTHGGTSSVLMAQLLQGNLETLRAFRFGNTAVSELHRRDEGSFLLVRYSDLSHLSALGEGPSLVELDAKSTIR